jgi:hypothetical protein
MVTEKEKKIIKILVKKFSKEDLKSKLRKYINTNGNEGAEYIEKMLMAMGYTQQSDSAIQYLKYCVDFYDNIVRDEFPDNIERIQSYEITVPATETEVVFVSYSVQVYSLPSLIDVLTEDVKENLWDYNPDRDILDYGDTLDVDYHYDEIVVSGPSVPLYRKTVIN